MQSTDPGGPTGQMSPDQMKSTSSWEQTKTWMVRWRGSRQLVLVIVAIALLLDNMLLTVVGEYTLSRNYFAETRNYQHQLKSTLTLIKIHDTLFAHSLCWSIWWRKLENCVERKYSVWNIYRFNGWPVVKYVCQSREIESERELVRG